MAAKKPGPSRALARVKTDAAKAKTRQLERAEALLALIDRRKADVLDAFYDIGVALRELLAEKLYVVLGHRSLQEMLEARGIMSYSHAKDLMAIVAATPRSIALDLGREKSLELARWTKATPAVDTPASVYRANEAIDGVRVRDASAKHIARARRKLETATRKKSGAVDPAERAAERAARNVQAFLRKHGARSAKAVARRTSRGWVVTADVDAADALEIGAYESR